MKHLSELCLSHARLLEEHGATIALLRCREAEVVDVERRENEARQTVEMLEVDVRALQKGREAKPEGHLSRTRGRVFPVLVAGFTAEGSSNQADIGNATIEQCKNQRIRPTGNPPSRIQAHQHQSSADSRDQRVNRGLFVSRTWLDARGVTFRNRGGPSEKALSTTSPQIS